MNKLKTKQTYSPKRPVLYKTGLKKAFTLVELIVVIVIIAVLATIAFISLQDYPRNARDGVRKGDLKSIEKVMNIHYIQKGELPEPDEPKTQSGNWIIGEFGTGVYAQIQKIHPLPVDPATKKYYKYELNPTTGKFRLTAQLENGQTFTAGNTTTNTTASTPTINPVQNPNTPVTFADHSTETLDGVTGYYTQSNTNLKWEANPSGSAQWATGVGYGEPTWNGTSYSYPSGTASNYPAFKHCTDKGPGWRLPTKNEFWSIMTDKATEKNANGYYTKLPSVSTDVYWSATESAPTTTRAWSTYFGYGTMFTNYKNSTNSILCIHD